jgi:hypothetical protein
MGTIVCVLWAPLLEHGEESGAWERSGMEKIRPKILAQKSFFSFFFPDI